MARRFQEITEVYRQEIAALARADRWAAFLRSACRNYKLPFEEQVLVHAQRPDATAVLEIERWNHQFGRWVNKGATGIAVFDRDYPGRTRLKYYFDISDTHESRLSRPVPLWQVPTEQEPDVIEALENRFGALDDKGTLEEAIVSAMENAAADNMTDYLDDLQNCRDNSLLEELDELKQEKRNIKRQAQLADDIIKEDLYTVYYAVSEKEEIVADRDVEIPGMEDEAVSEKDVAVEPETNVEVVNPDNNQNEIGRQKEQADSARKQQTDLDGKEISEIHNSSDVNVTRIDESITDVTGKSEFVEIRETEPVDKVGRIVRRISEFGGYENVSDSVKADIYGFDIADVSGSIRLFSDVMKKLGIKLDGDGLYEEFQRIYDEAASRDVDKGKAEDKMRNRGRGR